MLSKLGLGFHRQKRRIGTVSGLQASLPITTTDSAGLPILAQGTGPVTFTRASKQYILDFEGDLRPVSDGCAAIEGSRVVTNWAKNFSDGSWIASGTATKTDLGDGSWRIDFPTAGDSYSQNIATWFRASNGTDAFCYSFEMAMVSGTGSIQVSDRNGAGFGFKDIALTTTFQRFSVLVNVTSQGLNIGPYITRSGAGQAAAILIRNPQVEVVTGQTAIQPGDYVPTTISPVTQCFSYLNPYTANASTGLVTDSGIRTPITGIKGILLEPTSSNKASYSIIPGDTLGTEKATNGAFAADTNWTKDAGWTIAGGVAQLTSSTGSNSIYQSVTGVIGKIYQTTFTINSISGGTLQVRYGTGGAPTTFTTTGSKTITKVWDGTDANLYIQSAAAGVTSAIDNVSVKEVILAIGTKASSVSPTTFAAMTLSGYTQTTGNLVVGAVYKINARTTLDFTTCGSANNTVGTVFTATVAGALGAGDSVDNQSVSLSVVDDTAALQTAGLYGIAGAKVYKLDNSLGNVTLKATISGSTTNLNTHSAFVYARGGSGTMADGWDNTTWTNITTNANYQKYTKNALIPVNAGTAIKIIANAGQTIYFCMQQLEEQAWTSSPMPTSGSMVTRAAITFSIPYAGNLNANNFTVYLEAIPYAPGVAGKTPNVFSTQTDANNLYSIFSDQGTALTAQKKVAGVNTGRVSNYVATITQYTLYKIASVIRNTGQANVIFVNGTKGTSTSVDTANILSGSSIIFGDTTGPFAIKNVRIYNKALTDAELITMTT